MWLKPSASPRFLHRIHGWKSALRNTTIVSQYSNIVSHMPRCAQGVYQNHDKLERNLPPCFAISFLFPPTLSPLNVNAWLHCLFFSQDVCQLPEASLMSNVRTACFVQPHTCMRSVVSDTEAKTLAWHQCMSSWEARANLPECWQVYKHYLTVPDEYSEIWHPGRRSAIFPQYST